LDSEFEIKTSKGDKHGIFGTKVDVIDLNAGHNHDHDHVHHDHHHHHDDHHHDDHHHDDHDHHHDHTGMRDYGEIKKIIQDSSLNERVKKFSIRIFEEVARA